MTTKFTPEEYAIWNDQNNGSIKTILSGKGDDDSKMAALEPYFTIRAKLAERTDVKATQKAPRTRTRGLPKAAPPPPAGNEPKGDGVGGEA